MGIHSRRGDANVVQQRQPLSPATADVKDTYAVPACVGIDELPNVGQVAPQLGCDLLRRSAEASGEVGVEGSETGAAPLDLLLEPGQISLEFRLPLTSCCQLASRSSVAANVIQRPPHPHQARDRPLPPPAPPAAEWSAIPWPDFPRRWCTARRP